MPHYLADERLETLCRNTAAAVAAGFTTFVLAMWARTGQVEGSHLVATVLVWVVLLVASRLRPPHEAS